jgi:hypothetical protein
MWFKRGLVVSVLLLAFVLFVVMKPVPNAYADYVGEWTSASMYLRIDQYGYLMYKRTKPGGNSVSISGFPIRFEGQNFSAGFGPLSTLFVVRARPLQDGGQWKMVVDGVELTKR